MPAVRLDKSNLSYNPSVKKRVKATCDVLDPQNSHSSNADLAVSSTTINSLENTQKSISYPTTATERKAFRNKSGKVSTLRFPGIIISRRWALIRVSHRTNGTFMTLFTQSLAERSLHIRMCLQPLVALLALVLFITHVFDFLVFVTHLQPSGKRIEKQSICSVYSLPPRHCVELLCWWLLWWMGAWAQDWDPL